MENDHNSLTILIIADDPDIQVTLRTIIHKVFPTALILTEPDGLKGRDSAMRHDPDLILLDDLIAGMDSLDICASLKADNKGADLPVVYLTDLTGDKNKHIKALECGAEAFLSKPIDQTELTAQIRAMVKVKKANTQKNGRTGELESLIKERTRQLEQELEERKKVEKSLRESEERFQMLFNQAPLGYQSLDSNGYFIEVNQQWLNTLGYSREEVIGKWFGDFLSPEYQDGFRQRFPIFKSLGTIHSEFEMVHKNGSKLFIAFEGKIGYTLDGNFKQTHCILQDITENKKSVDALVASEQRFKHIFESSNVGKSITSPTGEINVNQAFCDMLGYRSDELKNKNWQEITPPEDIITTDRLLSSMLNGEKDHIRFNKRYIHKNGSLIWCDVSVALIRDSKGKPLHFITTVIDINERIEAEKALLESDENIHALLNGLPESAFLMKPDGTVIAANATVAQRLKLSEDQLINTNMYSHVDQQVASKREEYARQAIEMKKLVQFEDERNGRVIDNRIYPIIDQKGEVSRLAVIGIDITERKKWEEALLSEKQKAETYLNIAEVILVAFDHEGKIILLNRKGYEVLGYPEGDLLGKDWFQVCLPDEDYKPVKSVFEKLMTGVIEPVEYFENYIKTKNGSKRLIAWHNSIIRNDKGQIIGTLSSGEDITERKEIENELSELNDLLSKFILNSPIYTYIKEVSLNESRVLKASENFIDMVGIPGSQMEGKTMHELFPTEFADKISADDWNVASTGQMIQIEEELNGKYYTTIKFPIKEGERVFLAGYTIDMTDRKQKEMELRKLSRALEQSPDSILITNTKGEIEFVNPALIRLSEYSAEELIGENPRIFKSGETTSEQYRTLWETITSGKVWEGEFHNRKKNGELFWESATVSPVFDSSGQISHYLAIRKDITEQKRITQELIRAKDKAEESDRLKSAFLANMSHEIRTPMNSIMGFASLLPEEESKELLAKYANIILSNSEQLVHVIDDVVLYSRLQTKMLSYFPVSFDAQKIITDIKHSFDLPEFQKEVKVVVETSTSEPEIIETDYEKLRQIFTNLVSNAFKYTPKGTISIGFTKQSARLVFFVRDTGIGIPANEHKKVFDRFYRASNVNNGSIGGTGLGLSIVKELVDLLGGEIWVESEPGKGSLFCFTIKNH